MSREEIQPEGACAIALRAPKPLRPGDQIVAFASGGKVDRAKVIAGAELLEAQGYRVTIPESVYATSAYYAGDAEHRNTQLQRALGMPDVRALWAVRGGSGTAQAAQALTFQDAEKGLPWLVGFSDVTSLHGLWGQHRMQSLHGADLQTLPSWSRRHVVEMLDLLAAPSGVSQIFEGAGNQTTDRSVAVGRLWGGNLTVLASLAGTPLLLPPQEDSILFLEDVGEAPYRLDRALNQLAQSGALARVRGVALGAFTWATEQALSEEALGLVHTTLTRLNLPTVSGLAVGHTALSRPLLLGVQATLDARRGTLVVGA